MSQMKEHFSTEKQTPLEVVATEPDLQEALEQIQRRRGGDQLMRLLQDLAEGGQLEPFEEQSGDRPTRCWRVTAKNDFASRFFAIDNDVQSSIAELFLRGLVIFSLELRPGPEIVWRVAEISRRIN